MQIDSPIFLFFYIPVIGRLLLFFLHDGVWGIRPVNRLIGRLELYFGWVRDTSMIPFSLFVFGERVTHWIQFGYGWSWPYELIFLGLSIYARWWRWRGLVPLPELAKTNPHIHPAEFFEHLYGRFGFLPHRVPAKADRFVDPLHLDFRSGRKPVKSFWIYLAGTYNTFIFARLVAKAFRWKGAKTLRAAGGGLTLVYASRIAQLAKMEVRLERPSNLREAEGSKLIYAVSHKSVFDFCLAPLAYGGCVPFAMVAKDHFKDNFFLSRLLGIGAALEAWGMIFVDRKSRKSEGAGRAKEAVSLAVKKLLAGQMAFSIYPQGTRARGQMDRYGGRWDAGYFCVGNKERLKKEGGYFKKGVATVAVVTALSLLKHKLGGKVSILPVAMLEVGTACPKGSLKVQTETSVTIKMGEPILIRPEEMSPFKNLSFQEIAGNLLYERKVFETAEAIDRSLQQLLGVATRLERRFFIDLREMMPPRAVEEVAIAFKSWRQETLVYQILDCIYALPEKRWYALLVELAQSLREHESREKLTSLRNKTADYF